MLSIIKLPDFPDYCYQCSVCKCMRHARIIDRYCKQSYDATRDASSTRAQGSHNSLTHRNLHPCNLPPRSRVISQNQSVLRSALSLSYFVSTFHHNGHHRKPLKQSPPNVNRQCQCRRQRQSIRVRVATAGQVSRRSSRGTVIKTQSDQKAP